MFSYYPCHKCSGDRPKYTVDENGFPVCVDCADGRDCPNCNNDGSYGEHDCGGNLNDCANNCPVQVQCEFCFTVEDSKFMLREKRNNDRN